MAMCIGNQSIKAEKTKVYDGHLIGIGWHFDFVKWTVKPKDMARRRLLYRWWVLLQSCESQLCLGVTDRGSGTGILRASDAYGFWFENVCGSWHYPEG